MKKLVTAACALVAASAFAVESANTVGYEVQSYEGPRTQSVRFQGVGSNGSAVNITNVLDGTLVADYSDTIEIYDGETGDFTAYMWDTTQWFDALTDDPIAMTTRADDGFILTTGLDTITQHINVVAVQEGE